MKTLVEHHHLLARIETEMCPDKKDRRKMELILERLVEDVKMKKLGNARMFYVNSNKYPEKTGMSGIVPIQTSHISFHYWSHPGRNVLSNADSNCLLQFDLYTCGKLTKTEIKEVLHIFDVFVPTHANVTLINRKYGMKIESNKTWNRGVCGWNKFVDRYRV